MVDVFGKNIKSAFTGGKSVNAIYSYGVKVWPGDTPGPEPEDTRMWVTKEFNIKPTYGYDIWNDNDGHTYYSDLLKQYELVNGVWIEKVWDTPYVLYFGQNIWRDYDGNIYYDNYRLVNNELVETGWDHLYGFSVWRADGHIYYSHEGVNKELVNGVWVSKSWDISISRAFDCIWNDNNGHAYYSYGDDQYVLVNGVWEVKEWTEYHHPYNASSVWSDGKGHLYYDYNWELKNGVWIDKEWKGETQGITGLGIWHDADGNIYCSNNYNTSDYNYQLVQP